jgi:hypothetical protein
MPLVMFFGKHINYGIYKSDWPEEPKMEKIELY